MTDQLKFDDHASRELEMTYFSPKVVARRRAALALLDLQPGESVLDVGTGPGFLADEIAEIIGVTGRVVGIDRSPAMLALARHRCAQRAYVTFHGADATAIPVQTAAFDAAAVVQVYEYVADVPAALRELHRALRPGGRAVIVDIDWASLVWEAENRGRAERIFSAWEEHVTDPHLPRRLALLLSQSGFEVSTVEPYTIVCLSPEPFPAGLTKLIAGFVPGRRGVTSEDATAWLADLATMSARETYFFSVTTYLFLASRATRSGIP